MDWKPMPIDSDLQDLIEKSMKRGPMTPAEIQEQRICFVYGQLPEGNTQTKDDVRQMDYARFGNLQPGTKDQQP